MVTAWPHLRTMARGASRSLGRRRPDGVIGTCHSQTTTSGGRARNVLDRNDSRNHEHDFMATRDQPRPRPMATRLALEVVQLRCGHSISTIGGTLTRRSEPLYLPPATMRSRFHVQQNTTWMVGFTGATRNPCAVHHRRVVEPSTARTTTFNADARPWRREGGAFSYSKAALPGTFSSGRIQNNMWASAAVDRLWVGLRPWGSSFRAPAGPGDALHTDIDRQQSTVLQYFDRTSCWRPSTAIRHYWRRDVKHRLHSVRGCHYNSLHVIHVRLCAILSGDHRAEHTDLRNKPIAGAGDRPQAAVDCRVSDR